MHSLSCMVYIYIYNLIYILYEYINMIKKERKYSQTKSYPLFWRELDIHTVNDWRKHQGPHKSLQCGRVWKRRSSPGTPGTATTECNSEILFFQILKFKRKIIRNCVDVPSILTRRGLRRAQKTLRCSLHRSSLSFFFKALASINTIWLGSTCQVLISIADSEFHHLGG